ncbi:sensor histidine kinase [Novosphingobium sp. UBA1939]|uniref:sensor histidine kinase n=1 Tax=Novosphingobium sp. UBA1939 TaxID=1946982 RepID=UPI0025D401F2|nr:HAMP domain-containing sensor histidine kinase [Novosphingobium sp. UBA1939]
MPGDWPHLRDIRKTSTFRLTLALGGAATVGVLLLLLIIYSLTERELNDRSDRILRTEIARLAALPEADLPGEIDKSSATSVSGLNHFGLLSPGGRWLAGDMGASPPLVIGHPYERDDGPDVRGPLRILAARTPGGALLMVGRDVRPIVDLRGRMVEILVLSGLFVAPLLLAAGFAVSLGPLRRVDRLQRVALEIGSGRLAARMPIEGRGDELDLFAGTVNRMIGEVERTVDQVKSVTDAIAHDLRTPLTRVRNQLYRASRDPDMAPADVVRIEAAMANLDLVLARFAALLRISELEASGRRQGFATSRIDRLLDAVVELYGPLAEERDIALRWDGAEPVHLYCDEKLIFEAFSNLVDNAIKFAPEGGRVSILLAKDDGFVAIEVCDNGPGIPMDQLQAVLRRYDRGVASAAVPGSGLGLSVVAAIVHLHHFALELLPAEPGLRARIVAPVEAQQAR